MNKYRRARIMINCIFGHSDSNLGKLYVLHLSYTGILCRVVNVDNLNKKLKKTDKLENNINNITVDLLHIIIYSQQP